MESRHRGACHIGGNTEAVPKSGCVVIGLVRLVGGSRDSVVHPCSGAWWSICYACSSRCVAVDEGFTCAYNYPVDAAAYKSVHYHCSLPVSHEITVVASNASHVPDTLATLDFPPRSLLGSA